MKHHQQQTDTVGGKVYWTQGANELFQQRMREMNLHLAGDEGASIVMGVKSSEVVDYARARGIGVTRAVVAAVLGGAA